MSEELQASIGELSTEVLEKFLAGLEQEGIPDEVRARLRQTLLVESKFSDTALRNAVFGEDAQQ